MKIKIIAAVSLVLIFLTIVSIVILNKKIDSPVAKIYQNSLLIKEIDLQNNKEIYTFKVIGENGLYNIIEVQENKIRVIEASCPDKICVNQGFIENGVLPIVCLPNRVEIKIENRNTKIDGVAK